MGVTQNYVMTPHNFHLSSVFTVELCQQDSRPRRRHQNRKEKVKRIPSSQRAQCQRLSQTADLKPLAASLSQIRLPSDLLNPMGECRCVCRTCPFKGALRGGWIISIHCSLSTPVDRGLADIDIRLQAWLHL